MNGVYRDYVDDLLVVKHPWRRWGITKITGDYTYRLGISVKKVSDTATYSEDYKESLEKGPKVGYLLPVEFLEGVNDG